LIEIQCYSDMIHVYTVNDDQITKL
jgi:hypothetical protein